VVVQGGYSRYVTGISAGFLKAADRIGEKIQGPVLRKNSLIDLQKKFGERF